MLRSLSGIAGYRIEAIDGDAGRVQDFVFNDFLWTVRHAVAASGSFRHRKRIAIRCSVLGQPRWESQVLPAGLTLAQLQQRTGELELEPASRRRDFAFSEDNWLSPLPFPGTLALAVRAPAPVANSEPNPPDPQLRSVQEVIGYSIRSRQGRIGRVDDFIVDDEHWSIRYIAVSIGNWMPRKKVLIEPEWIESISADERDMVICLSNEGIESSPDYDPLEPVNSQYQVRRYDYTGRPGGWD